jgi:hypothetical protein
MQAKHSMKLISTRTHGILDYVTAGFALTFPRLLRCSDGFTNAVTMLALGKLGYSMLTKHELGLAKVIPMKVHLAMDAVGGAAMAALPFVMDEDDPTAVACAVGMGLFDIAAAPMTQTIDVERSGMGSSSSMPSHFGGSPPPEASRWRVTEQNRSGMPTAATATGSGM